MKSHHYLTKNKYLINNILFKIVIKRNWFVHILLQHIYSFTKKERRELGTVSTHDANRAKWRWLGGWLDLCSNMFVPLLCIEFTSAVLQTKDSYN